MRDEFEILLFYEANQEIVIRVFVMGGLMGIDADHHVAADFGDDFPKRRVWVGHVAHRIESAFAISTSLGGIDFKRDSKGF